MSKRILDGVITAACIERLKAGAPEEIELSDGTILRMTYSELESDPAVERVKSMKSKGGGTFIVETYA